MSRTLPITPANIWAAHLDYFSSINYNTLALTSNKGPGSHGTKVMENSGSSQVVLLANPTETYMKFNNDYP